MMAKPGLDGHDVGVKVLGHGLVQAGFEVVYTGLRKTIQQIVQLAVDYEVNLIALSILSGTHLVLCEQMAKELKARHLSIPWIVGGNLPETDVEKIKKIGAVTAFATGTTIKKVIDFCDQLAEGQE